MPSEPSQPSASKIIICSTAASALGGMISVATSKIPGTAFTNMTNPDRFGQALGAGAGAGAVIGAISGIPITLITLGAYGVGKGFGAGLGSQMAGDVLGSSASVLALAGSLAAKSMAVGALEKAMIPSAFTGNARETAVSQLGAESLAVALVVAAPAAVACAIGVGYGAGVSARGVYNAAGYVKNKISEKIEDIRSSRSAQQPDLEAGPTNQTGHNWIRPESLQRSGPASAYRY